MGDVVHVDFGRGRGRSAGPNNSRVVSMTWNIARSAVMVWVIDINDRSTDEEVGLFTEHRAAVQAAAAVATARDLLLVDHTAIAAGGVWSHRPVATGVHVYPSALGFYIAVEPDSLAWSAHGGFYPNIDVAGDRAVELCEALRLPIFDHVLTGGVA